MSNKQIGIKILINGVAGAGKSSTLKTLENAYVLYADTKKRFPFSTIPHTNIYTYKEFRKKKKIDGKVKVVNELPTKAIEYTGIDNFLKEITAKLAIYKKTKGKLPDTVAIDAVTNVYKLIADYIKTTTVNNYGSHSADTAKDTDKFLSWIEREIIGRGINVILLAHATVNRDTGDLQVATSGSKTFEDVGGFMGSVNYATYIYTNEEGVRIAAHKDNAYSTVCRNLLDNLEEEELLEEFDLQEMITKIRDNESKASEMEI